MSEQRACFDIPVKTLRNYNERSVEMKFSSYRVKSYCKTVKYSLQTSIYHYFCLRKLFRLIYPCSQQIQQRPSFLSCNSPITLKLRAISVVLSPTQKSYNRNQIQQKQRSMHEYESNIDFIDIFHLLTLNHPQESQMISMNSQVSEPSHFHLHDQSQNLQQKLEGPTTDKEVDRLCGAQLQKKNEGLTGNKTIDFRWQVRSRYEQVRQGSKDDTVELNINFKTILINYFKELLLVNELSSEEAQLVLEFSARSPSFKSLQAFFSNPHGFSRISSQCSKIINSSLIIRRILQSRCKVVTKVQMIKFVEVLRRNINSGGNIKKWKQAVRK